MYRDLASYARHANPLSLVRPVQFQEVHNGNTLLLRELTRKKKSIRRRAKANRILRKVGGCGLVVLHMTLVVSMLVIALHSFVGIVAAPAIVGCSSSCLLAKKGKRRASLVIHGRLNVSLMERVCRQLDLAAKGTFILINDFDTMSRLATSLNNEAEHSKVLSAMCVRNNKNEELLRLVVRELCDHDACYLEQLEELEEHVYLCFHTINRSRRFVMQEMMIGEEEFGFEGKEEKVKDYDGDSKD
ncbi:unnamed protein product [Linum tenue]|nr:unnamed protein product [Linum tenue]